MAILEPSRPMPRVTARYHGDQAARHGRTGLDGQYLRAAVRAECPRLAGAIAEVLQ